MSLNRDTRAASGIEYAMLVGLVAMVSLGAVKATGIETRSLFSDIASALTATDKSEGETVMAPPTAAAAFNISDIPYGGFATLA